MASNDWFSKNFPTLVRLVALLQGARAQRRKPRGPGRRRGGPAQQEAMASGGLGQPAGLGTQQAVAEPPSAAEAAVLTATSPVGETSVVPPSVPVAPVGTVPSPTVETLAEPPSTPAEPVVRAPSPPMETAVEPPRVAAEPVGIAPTPPVEQRPTVADQTIEPPQAPPVQPMPERPPIHREPTPRPAASAQSGPETSAPVAQSWNIAQMYDTWVDLEGSIGATRADLDSLLSRRKNAEAMRSSAQEVLEQAEAAWEEAGRLGEAARRAFEQGFTANLPGFANRLRAIKEIYEARKAQAQLRRGTNLEAWEEADRARHRATAELLKALTSIAAASAQVDREVREANNLPAVAESLRSSALEDLRGAQAIDDELTLVSREALGQLASSQVADEDRREDRPASGPSAPQIVSQQVSGDIDQDVHRGPVEAAKAPQAAPEEPPPRPVSEPQYAQPGPVAPEVVESTPSSAADALRREFEMGSPPADSGTPDLPQMPEPPGAPKAVEPGAISTAQALRMEFEAAASAASPQDGDSPRLGGDLEGPESGTASGPATSLVEELERGRESSRIIPASNEPPVVSADPPLAPETASAAGGIQSPPQGLASQAQVDAGTAGLPGDGQLDTSGSLAESYSGRLYLMFPSSLGQNELETVWEVLDEVAGAGAIVDNRLVSQEAGIQFTLELRNKALSIQQLQNRMPGAGLMALGPDRVKVDWPR